MTESQRHIIQKQTVELACITGPGDYALGVEVQNRVSDLIRKTTTGALSELFSRLCPAGTVIRLDQLTVNLGHIQLDQLEATFEASLLRSLEERLHEQMGKNQSVRSPDGSQTDPVSVRWQAFLYFLQNGVLPWWETATTIAELEVAVLDKISNNPAACADTLRPLFQTHPSALARCIIQFSDVLLVSLLESLFRFSGASFRALLTELTDLLAQSRMISLLSVRKAFWTAALQLPSGSTQEAGEKACVGYVLQQFLYSPATAIRQESNSPKANEEPTVGLADNQTDNVSKVSDDTSRTNWNEPSALADRQTGSPANDGVNVPPVDQNNVPKEAGKAQRNDFENSLPYEASSAKRRSEADTPPNPSVDQQALHELVERSKDWIDVAGYYALLTQLLQEYSAKKDNSTAAPGQLPDTYPANLFSILAQLRAEHPIAVADLRPHHQRVDSAGSSVTKPARPEPLPAGQTIYIANAGVILVHPFLPTLFRELNLVAGKAFVSEAARHRATYLLQYLVSGSEESAEFDLPLAKILCGIPLQTPIEPIEGLTEVEMQELENLLQAVIDHWKILRTTSPAGLRSTFLQRLGKLDRKEADWLLRVEQHSVDLLLDHLPWGIRTIRLPWMNEILYSEW